MFVSFGWKRVLRRSGKFSGIASRFFPRRSHFEISRRQRKIMRDTTFPGSIGLSVTLGSYRLHLKATKLFPSCSGCIISQNNGLSCYSAFISPLYAKITVTSFVRDQLYLFLRSLWETTVDRVGRVLSGIKRWVSRKLLLLDAESRRIVMELERVTLDFVRQNGQVNSEFSFVIVRFYLYIETNCSYWKSLWGIEIAIE